MTSPYALTLNEKSSLNRHDGPTEHFVSLLRFPTKPIAGYFPLRDVHTRGASLKGLLSNNKYAFRCLFLVEYFRYKCRPFSSC